MKNNKYLVSSHINDHIKIRIEVLIADKIKSKTYVKIWNNFFGATEIYDINIEGNIKIKK